MAEDEKYLVAVNLSPSFSSYAIHGDAGTFSAAIRVSREQDTSGWWKEGSSAAETETEFEFKQLSHEAADANGKSVVFPVFDRHIAETFRVGNKCEKADENSEQRSLVKPSVFKDCDPQASSEDEEFEKFQQPVGHCFWPSPRHSSGLCKKSKSTGSSSSSASRWWRIRDLLRRCHSERKDSTATVYPAESRAEVRKNEKSNRTSRKSETRTPEMRSPRKGLEAAAVYYSRNAAIKDGYHQPRRVKSYLPYKQELVGIFAGLYRSEK